MVADHNKEDPGESTVVEEPAIEDDTPILDRGAVVGRYLVADRIGRGGMSEVYKAFDPDLNRPVALKLLTVKKNKRDDTGLWPPWQSSCSYSWAPSAYGTAPREERGCAKEPKRN